MLEFFANYEDENLIAKNYNNINPATRFFSHLCKKLIKRIINITEINANF